jgi:methionine synthase I (cobalamin-dependent)
MATKFLEALHSGRVLLMDGAMGTELQRAGMQAGECYELWNLTHPEKVLAIHRAYVEAGAEVLLTNTFQAFESRLVRLDLVQKMLDIWWQGWKLAQSAGEPPPFVLASLGPGEWQNLGQFFLSLQDANGLLLETLDSFQAGKQNPWHGRPRRQLRA